MKWLRIIGMAFLMPMACQGCSQPTENNAQPNRPSPPRVPTPPPMQARTETNAEEYLGNILKIPLNKLEAEAQEMEKQLKASPNNPELKTKTAEANFKAGYAMMMAPELAPRVKYRGALKYFRRTLALNPTHKYAAESKQTIEAIYQQMGRPIPQ